MKQFNFVFFSYLVISTITIQAQTKLLGSIGSSKQWYSGWIDLTPVMDFSKGDTLEILVGGTANQVYLRLLAKGDDFNSSNGIEGDKKQIPSKSRIIRVVLGTDYKQISQISVHGGPNPWGFKLSLSNGQATIGWIRLFRKQK